MTTTAQYLNRINRSKGISSELSRWAALPVVLAGTAMVVLDFFIVNVAMPAIQGDLGASEAALQWVLAGYGLAFGAGLITAGRLGDHFGRRRMFIVGLALFTITSAACGIAPSAGVLVGSRVAQGAASALLMPQVLAIIGVAYQGEDRVKAMTAYALTMGLAAVAGQLLGGLLIDADVAGLGWRSCFLVNVPVGVAALVLTPRVVPESRAESSSRLDLFGAAVVTAALVAIVLPLIQGREQGWPAWTWISLAVAPVLLADFALTQRKLAGRGGSPLVHPGLFAERSFGVGLAGVVLFQATMASFFLVLALYLQDGRGLSPVQAGLLFTLIGAGYMGTSIVASKATERLGRQALALGAGLRVIGLLGMWAAVGEVGSGGSVAWLVVPMLIDGAGMGFLTGPLMTIVLANVPAEYAGAASGVLSTAQQVGNAIGVAVIGVFFFGAIDGGHSIIDAFRGSLIDLAVASALLGLLVQLLPGRRSAPAREPARPVPEPAQASA
jgi:EmrB/QacA subfamily drug resistance transporter